jgi:hypothetical protein
VECCQAASVEARDQISHRRATVQAGLMGGVDEHARASDRQQRSGSAHDVDSLIAPSDDPF